LFHLLLALAAILAAGRGLGRLFSKIGQPPVIGEVLAGILLGPSFLGWIAPEFGSWLLPSTVAPYLGVVAQLGVILYMFQVGLELNLSEFKGRGKATIAISAAGMLLPFALGLGLALWLHPRYAEAGKELGSFAFFIGVAMSITAFPVLARILTDSGLSRSRLGAMALSCAAIDDATAWCLLAMVSGVVSAEMGSSAWVFAGFFAYAAAMFLFIRPLLASFAAKRSKPPLSQGTVAAVLLMVLLSSLLTEFIGIHAIFGAFLLGVLIPHDSAIARGFEEKLRDLVAVLLLPAFFAFTGMRTQVSLLGGWEAWGACLLIVLVATAGKFLGVAGSARLSGMGARDAAALGILMNTRGLVELIVLNVGLDLKVITPRLFAMMVLMALSTTLATAPALRIFTPGLLPKRN
jgi:Kef-type K+ transport system membrane component KefB